MRKQLWDLHTHLCLPRVEQISGRVGAGKNTANIVGIFEPTLADRLVVVLGAGGGRGGRCGGIGGWCCVGKDGSGRRSAMGYKDTKVLVIYVGM